MSDKEGKEVLGMDSNATYISPSDFEKIIDSIPLIIRVINAHHTTLKCFSE